MMKCGIWVKLWVLFFLAFSGSLQAKKKGIKKPNGTIKAPVSSLWNQEMKAIGHNFTHLYPLVLNDKNFEQEESLKVIKKQTALLALHAQKLTLPQVQKSIKAGRHLDLMVAHFRSETLLAHEQLNLGNLKYAQLILQALPNQCMACHTRTAGPENSAPPELKVGPNTSFPETTLSAEQKGDFYSSTRQFDKALQEYEKFLVSGKRKKNIFQIESALEKALAVAIRVKKQPETAKKITEATLEHQNIPELEEQNLQIWLQSMSKLQEEQKSLHPQVTLEKEELIRQINELQENIKKTQKYPADQSAQIFYLKLSSLAHQYLEHYAQSDYDSAVVFHLLGKAYSALADENLWGLHESYFIKCIQSFPHSEIAVKCYQDLQNSIELGYTGSGGTHIPKNVQNMLKKFKALSQFKTINNPNLKPVAL